MNKKLTSKILMIASAVTIASPCYADLVDATGLKSVIDDFMDQTMKNPSAVDGNIVYQLTSAEACEAFAPSAPQSVCDTVASKFKVTQLVYVDSATAGEGKITWSYDNNDLMVLIYSPATAQVDMKFSDSYPGVAAFLADVGDDPLNLTNNLPNAGAAMLLVDHSVGNVSTVKVSFPEEINHSASGFHATFPQNSFLQLTTTPSSHLAAMSMDLDSAFVELPGSFDPFHPAATTTKYSFGDFNGKLAYNLSNGAISTENLLINHLNVEADSVVALSVDSSTAMTATVDIANKLFTSLTAVDLNISVLDSAFPISQGEYKFKADANALMSSDLASTLDVNVQNLLIQAPADQLATLGVTQFAAGTTAQVVADELTGSLALTSASGASTLNMDAFKITNFAVKEDAAYKIQAHHNSGSLDGSVTSDFATGGSLSLAAQDLQIDVLDTLGFPQLSVGTYHLVNGAGTTGNGSYIGTGFSGVLSATYNMNGVSLNIPQASGAVDFAMNATGTINWDPGFTGSQNVLAGSIGTGHLTIGSENIGTWSQSAPTTIALDSSIPTLLLSFNDATTISVSHNNTIPDFGTGDILLTVGANTVISNTLTTVDSGSAEVTVTGNPYAALFGAGGMFEGVASGFTCAGGVVGPCSFTVH